MTPGTIAGIYLAISSRADTTRGRRSTIHHGKRYEPRSWSASMLTGLRPVRPMTLRLEVVQCFAEALRKSQYTETSTARRHEFSATCTHLGCIVS